MQFDSMKEVYSEEQMTLSKSAPKDLPVQPPQTPYRLPQLVRAAGVGVTIITLAFIYLAFEFNSTRAEISSSTSQLKNRISNMKESMDKVARTAQRMTDHRRDPNSTIKKWKDLTDKINTFYQQVNPEDQNAEIASKEQNQTLEMLQADYYNKHRLLDLLDGTTKEIVISKRNNRFRDISRWTPQFRPPHIRGPWNSTHNHFHSPQIDTLEKRYISRAIQAEQGRLHSRFNINAAINELPMCVVVSTLNNGQGYRYAFNLGSILAQNYNNYKLVIVDQGSIDKTGERIKAYMYERGYRPDQYIYIRGQDQSLGMKYFYDAVKEHCLEGQIVVPIYGSDQLVGPFALRIINSVYQNNKIGLTFSHYFQGFPKQDIYAPIRVDPFKALQSDDKQYMNAHRLFGHLIVFRAQIFHSIQQQRLKYQNGSWISPQYPQAWILPLIELSCSRYMLIDEYQYLMFYGTNDHHPNWSYNHRNNSILKQIRSKEKYSCLQTYQQSQH